MQSQQPQPYITFSVKGNRHQGALAASAHGIPAAFLREILSSSAQPPTSVFQTNASQLNKLARWYSQPGQHLVPFPIGTLLVYSYHVPSTDRSITWAS